MAIKVGVKYCGGCNPTYDRSELVEDLKRRLDGKVKFVPPDGEGVDLILAVEGCEIACADLSPFECKRIFIVKGVEDVHRFIKLIAILLVLKDD